jgi:hypothetical protein
MFIFNDCEQFFFKLQSVSDYQGPLAAQVRTASALLPLAGCRLAKRRDTPE